MDAVCDKAKTCKCFRVINELVRHVSEMESEITRLNMCIDNLRTDPQRMVFTDSGGHTLRERKEEESDRLKEILGEAN